jgi:predicted permease
MRLRAHQIARLSQDVRYAARSLRKDALSSTIVVATLALGIGLSVGMFSFLNAQILRAHVDRDFESYARIYTRPSLDPVRPGPPGNPTWDEYVAFREQARTVRDLAAWTRFEAILGTADAQPVRALFVTCNFFELYDRPPIIMGRVLQVSDCSSTDPVIVIGERQWRTRLLADPHIVGQVVRFNGRPATVVGVVGAFAGQIDGTGGWLPTTVEPQVTGRSFQGDERRVTVAGRLSAGSTHTDATTELTVLANRQDLLHPGRVTRIVVTNGSNLQEPGSREGTMWLLSIVIFALTALLLVTCANVTTILLARAVAKRREIAVRLALGADRLRVGRMLLTETVMLALAAGAIASYVAYQLPDLVNRWIQDEAREWTISNWSFAPDWRVFGYLSLMTFVAAAAAGVLPALQALKFDLTGTLASDRTLRTPSGRRSLRPWLIGTQVAVGLVLLVGAGIFIHASERAARPGIDVAGLLSVRLHAAGGSPSGRSWDGVRQQIVLRLEAVAGVESVTFANWLPFQESNRFDVGIPGETPRRVAMNWVAPRFFETLRIAIVRGRTLDAGSQCTGGGCPAVVSERLAREFWPGRDPLGLVLRGARGRIFEVVGVATDVSSQRLGGYDDPVLYIPWNPNDELAAYQLLVRAGGDGRSTLTVVANAIREVVPEAAVNAELLQSRMADHLFVLGVIKRVVLTFAAVAIVLALVGIYGVVSFAARQRLRELAIRVALGARRIDIYTTMVRSEGRPFAAGLAAGVLLALAGAALLARALAGAPVEIRTRDPLAFAVSAALLTLVGLAVVLAAARRGARVDPLQALKEE